MATATQTEHGLRRETITRAILSDIFDGQYEPGARMKIEHLAEQYEVSATPIREALVELAGIGVLELVANRGAVLRPFGPRQLREICHVRRILESEAARCACGRIAPFELESLERELAELATGPRGRKWSERTQSLDTQLHELVAARCGNERLAYEIGRYRVLYRTLRDVHHQHRQSRQNYEQMEENAEHLAIARALAAGKPEEASAAMARHIDEAAAALEKDLFDDEQIAADTHEVFLTLPRTQTLPPNGSSGGRRKTRSKRR